MAETQPRGPCAVCGVRGLACGRCRAIFYCGRDHQRQDWQSHREHCRPAERDDSAAVPEHLAQASSALLRLPEAALLAVCGYLNGLDLVRLGLVCRGLRHLARHPRAWEHVDWEYDGHDPYPWEEHVVGYNKADAVAKGHMGVLRVAPALRSLKLNGARPRVDPLRCTRRVRVFEMEMSSDDIGCEEYHADGKVDIPRLVALLRHYKDYVQVVRLDALKTVKVLDTIETLRAIKELYVNSQLLRAWRERGSTKAVTKMKFWHEASADVAARLVTVARDTLKSFKVDGFRIYKNDVACSSKVGRALRLCANLETANIPIWDQMSELDSFPKLRRLCLFDLGYHDHADMKRYLASRPSVLHGLEALAVHLGFNAHRGIIKALAAACTELPVLRIMHTNTACTELTCQVDVARDLHKLLQPMKKLKQLVLSLARVPSTVFHGLRQGALPSLEVLSLRFCGVTRKGRAALEALKACRPTLQVKEYRLSAARYTPMPQDVFHMPDPRAQFVPQGRCVDGFCRQASDCEEDDPVVENNNSSFFEDGPDVYDFMMAVSDGSKDNSLDNAFDNND